MDSTPPLYPLRFRPILKQYIWGGRRLGELLGKDIGPGDDYAESWEVCDHGADQSLVAGGPLAGTTLAQLVAERGDELLGRHAPRSRFPLLLKFLDANRRLSLQVHPNDAQAALLVPPDLGKAEAWVVLATRPGSTIFAGLKPGTTAATLADAVRCGKCETLLHQFQPEVGDCVFLPAGTVHALGEGLVVAEIQQASDTTFRLFDWNRVGPDGRPRELHGEQALRVTDFTRGPVTPQPPQGTDRPHVQRLVECPQFVLDRWQFGSPQTTDGGNRFHLLAVIQGSVWVGGDPTGAAIPHGGTVLLPACAGSVQVVPQGEATLLDMYLP